LDKIDKIYWNDSENTILYPVNSDVNGLSAMEGAKRLQEYGPNK
jgi:hypothetical protein